MVGRKITPITQQLSNWLLAMLLVFSFFGASGPLALISFHSQKTATEAILSLKQRTAPPHSITYRQPTIVIVQSASPNTLSVAEHHAILAQTCLVKLQFRYLALRFSSVKPTLQHTYLSAIHFHSDHEI